MSASHEWTTWHLTPHGWAEGSSKLDAGSVTPVDPPHDRVLTCIYREYLGSMLGKWQVTVEEEWRAQDESGIQALLQQYGACPRHL